MKTWWRRSPGISRSELLAAIGVAVAATLVQFYTLVCHIGSRIASDLGDPLSQAWQIGWGGHALLHQPLAFWQANQFWPSPDSLAFSDALAGYAPLAMFGSGLQATIVHYNLAFLFSFALAFVAVWLLTRELGVGNLAALAGGAAFAFSPWRMQQGPHLHILSSGGIALALFLLLRGYRQQSAGLIIAGWLVAGWQQSIGFSLAIQMDYLLLLLGLIGAVTWVVAGRPKPSRGELVGTALGLVGFGIAIWWSLRPYARVVDANTGTSYSLSTVMSMSPSPWSFLAPPRQTALWDGWADWIMPRTGHGYSLYPGVVAALLALVGLFWKGVPKAIRIGLAVTTLGAMLLSLGVRLSGPGRFLPYRALHDWFPGWDVIRTPGRIHTVTTLALALLVAGGVALVQERLVARGRGQIGSALAVAATLLILADGSGIPYPAPQVPKPAAGLSQVEGPLVQIPAGAQNNREYLIWSTESFPKMVNGRSTHAPASYKTLIKLAAAFPAPNAIAALKETGIRSLVIHTEFSDQRDGFIVAGRLRKGPEYVSPSWSQALTVQAPVASGITRTLKRPLIIFTFPKPAG